MTKPGDAAWLTELREQVAARLKATGTTQVALADRLGITAKHMNRFLHGAVGAGNPLLLERMAEAVGLRITIADSGEPPPSLQNLRRRRRQVKALADLATAEDDDLAYVLSGIAGGTREKLRALLAGEEPAGGRPAGSRGDGLAAGLPAYPA